MTYRTSDATPVITAGAYSAGDAVGGKLTFSNVCTPYNTSGTIVQAHCIDKAKQNALLHLVLFDRDFTATADNAPFVVVDADLPHIVAVLVFSVANYISFDTASIGLLDIVNYTLSRPFILHDGGTDMYGQLRVKTSTPTYTATDDLRIELIIKG